MSYGESRQFSCTMYSNWQLSSLIHPHLAPNLEEFFEPDMLHLLTLLLTS